MDYLLLSMLAAVAVLMLCLMVSILANRGALQSMREAYRDSLAWGLGGFVSFAMEILMVWKLVW